jgi:hypothetical protein
MAAKAISSTGLINVGLAMFTIKSRYQLMDAQAFRVLRAAAMIAIINMALIITKTFVLSGRYVLALSLILMIFAAFYLADLFKYLGAKPIKDRYLKWLTIALVAFMLLSFVKNILPKAEGYNYMQDAVAWVKTNNQENKPVFYEESRMRYYAGAPFIEAYGETESLLDHYISNQSIKQYDYLLLNDSSNKPERINALMKKLPQYREIKRFNAYKNKKAVIVLKRNTQ